jgi:hypothetical protein
MSGFDSAQPAIMASERSRRKSLRVESFIEISLYRHLQNLAASVTFSHEQQDYLKTTILQVRLL